MKATNIDLNPPQVTRIHSKVQEASSIYRERFSVGDVQVRIELTAMVGIFWLAQEWRPTASASSLA